MTMLDDVVIPNQVVYGPGQQPVHGSGRSVYGGAHAKLLKLIERVGYLQKDGKNSSQGYKYLSEYKVKREVQKGLVAERLGHQTNVRVIHHKLLSWVEGERTRRAMHVIVQCTIELFDPDTGNVVTHSGLGEGFDYGDKATMKAQTVAVREAWKNALSIPSGNDSEADSSIDDDAFDSMVARIRACGTNDEMLALKPSVVQLRGSLTEAQRKQIDKVWMATSKAIGKG